MGNGNQLGLYARVLAPTQGQPQFSGDGGVPVVKWEWNLDQFS